MLTALICLCHLIFVFVVLSWGGLGAVWVPISLCTPHTQKQSIFPKKCLVFAAEGCKSKYTFETALQVVFVCEECGLHSWVLVTYTSIHIALTRNQLLTMLTPSPGILYRLPFTSRLSQFTAKSLRTLGSYVQARREAHCATSKSRAQERVFGALNNFST